MNNYYFKTKLVKMGRWNTPPLDIGTWMGEDTNRFFKKTFGVAKGLLTLYRSDDGYTHIYVPASYFVLLQRRINKINKNNYKALAQKLAAFYALNRKAKLAAAKIYKSSQRLSNSDIAKLIFKIRALVHKVVIFDQFGWLAEEYWTPLMRAVLEEELALAYGSEQYNAVLFALTKPERISTTLREKRAVLAEAINIKNSKSTFAKSGKILARQFGWMPIFTYGAPWQAEHYAKELRSVIKKKLADLKSEFQQLENYRAIRNREIAGIIKKYKLNKKSLQIFLDFGLAIDTRNEAEYFVSYAGALLMPLFDKARARLYLSPKQLRELTEQELFDALRGKQDLEKILAQKGKYGGWGYDRKMKKRINWTASEAEKLFKFVESYVQPVQGGNESQGTCASPGRVKGRIRIVAYPSQNAKVKNGDILVTYATTVDYLPAMKKAAAIITEVGGLTCHAAVVSREFGIPCIVALTNAMKNFKDGDMVEVDATKGIVKKLWAK